MAQGGRSAHCYAPHMNRISLRVLVALLTVAFTTSYAPAQTVSVPRVTLTPTLG